MTEPKITSFHIGIFFANGNEMSVLKFATVLQDKFDIFFKKEPEMIPVPEGLPMDTPRCVFSDEKKVSLSFSYKRMDFNYVYENQSGRDWRNQMEVCTLVMLEACKMEGLQIARIGLVITADYSETLISQLNEKISIMGFSESTETKVSYIIKKEKDGLNYNLCTIININEDEPAHKYVVQIDANTDKNSVLDLQNVEKKEVIAILTEDIKEKLKNVLG